MMIWLQIPSVLEVNWSICIPSENQQPTNSPSSSASLFFFFKSCVFTPLSYFFFIPFFCTSYCFPALHTPSLCQLSSAHFPSLFATGCITVAPCTLLPLSHACHSISSVTSQQLCPDFSEAAGSKIQYLPGKTQNQYPPNANTAHRQFCRSANDTHSCCATEFSDQRAEKKTTTLCFCQSHQKCFTRCTLNTVFSF